MTYDRIEHEPAFMTGKPVIGSTRIPVDLLLREAAGGRSIADIIDGYPRLTPENAMVSLVHATDFVAHEGLIAA